MPDWGDVLQEIQQFQKANKANPAQAALALDITRRKYLLLLQQHTKRNIIAYYSAWLSKPGLSQLDINDEDKNGFMMAVHKLDRKLGLDLILHTPGGNIAATQTIVNYLQRMFNRDIRAIVPQIAMSAGTMIACSCHTILMATHSNLGPIDPQLRDIPAYGVISEFRRALRAAKQDPSTIPIWQTIIGQYRPTFLSQCENAIQWSNAFVKNQLQEVMFKGNPGAAAKAASVVRKLTDYRGNRTHERHIHVEECEAMGLNVVRIEKDPILQDLALTVHHAYMHSLMNSAATKIIENHLGLAFVKQQAVIGLPPGMMLAPPSSP